MIARILTKRWNDPVEPDDGHRVLVCRYRPRGVRKTDETWDEWMPQLGPSRELHADYYGNHGPPIGWTEFRKRYVGEMKEERERIAVLAARVAAGETITFLCSSACTDRERCHRSLLKALVAGAPLKPTVKLTKEDIRKLVEVFLILDRWKREDDEKPAAERAK